MGLTGFSSPVYLVHDNPCNVMPTEGPEPTPTIKDFVMRYTPAALAIALIAGMTSSAGMGTATQPDPRAQSLAAEGRAALAAGNADGAIDAFEAALAIDPAYTGIYVDLGHAARAQGMFGKAIHFYREALERNPDDYSALAGEGEALAAKGALAGARENLARVQQLCGGSCVEAAELAAAIEHGPMPRVVTAEVTPDNGVSAN
jgi:tetratricopeptide (TPR) repeat protein